MQIFPLLVTLTKQRNGKHCLITFQTAAKTFVLQNRQPLTIAQRIRPVANQPKTGLRFDCYIRDMALVLVILK